MLNYKSLKNAELRPIKDFNIAHQMIECPYLTRLYNGITGMIFSNLPSLKQNPVFGNEKLKEQITKELRKIGRNAILPLIVYGFFAYRVVKNGEGEYKIITINMKNGLVEYAQYAIY